MNQKKFAVRSGLGHVGLSSLALLLAMSVGCRGDVGAMGGDGEGGDGGDGEGGDGGDGSGGNGGNGSGGNRPPPSESPVAFQCDNKAAMASPPLRRLTTSQYKNTLRDLIAWSLKEAPGTAQTQTSSVMSAIAGGLGRYPVDEPKKLDADLHGSYKRLDQDLQQSHVDVGYEIAMQVAAQLTTAQRLGTVVGSCATDADAANDTTCIKNFIKSFGERALRRPLEADEATFYESFYGSTAKADPAAFTDLIAGFLTAPQFMYLVEHGEGAVSGKADTFKLSNFEIASRLSYHFWQTMPDDALFEAARKGELTSTQGLTTHVDRLMADARAKSAMDEFFTDYMKLHTVPKLDGKINDTGFKNFATGAMVTGMLHQNMMDEAVAMARYFTWEKKGGVDDLMSSRAVFPKTMDLATIYGVGSAWNGTSTPPEVPADHQRVGLFTRAAFLSTGLITTRPIMKGVFLRTNVLCDVIPPPDANAANTPIDTSTKTTREAVVGITEQQGTGCRTCHMYMINGLGFATEGFDALGRYRKEERLFSEAGMETMKKPVETRTKPYLDGREDEREFAGPEEMTKAMVSGGKVHACFARHYFRYSFGRFEQDIDVPSADGCVVESLRKKIEKNGSIEGMLREVAMRPEFTQRQFKM